MTNEEVLRRTDEGFLIDNYNDGAHIETKLYLENSNRGKRLKERQPEE